MDLEPVGAQARMLIKRLLIVSNFCDSIGLFKGLKKLLKDEK